MLKNIRLYVLRFALVLVILLSTNTKADLFKFSALTNNSLVSGTLAEQLYVDVTDGGSGNVFFTIYNNYNPLTGEPFNTSPLISTITAVYFADHDMLGSGYIYDHSSGVLFDSPASPPTPPDDLKFLENFTNTFYASDAISPDPITNGISEWSWSEEEPEPWEYLTISFSLLGTYTYNDILTAMRDPLEGGLITAIHVQSIDGEDGNSDWFVTPLPGAAILGLLGLSVAGIKLRKYA